jgi:translation initiation factor IF-3
LILIAVSINNKSFILKVLYTRKGDKHYMYVIDRDSKLTKVSLIVNPGEGLTEMSLNDALDLAEERELDLVCISEKDGLVITKLADYNKLIYERQKREKENKKKARLNSQETKEIQIRDSIAEHDLQVKANNISRILNEGDKVRLVITYKGRSIKLIDEGADKLLALADKISTPYNIEKQPKKEGNKVAMVVAPVKK